MMYGITAFNAHLNIRSSPLDTTFEIDWQAFKTWNNAKMPQFAGRYFLGEPYLWAHGEATDVFNGERIPFIVPIQKADRERQEEKGIAGSMYGIEDAYALCSKLSTCLLMGELSLVGKYVPVFLEVEKGTKLSAEYWTAWCNLVVRSIEATVKEVDIQGTNVPVPSILFPFLPCIYCEFTKNAAGKYTVDADVRACLEATGKSSPGQWEKTACRGFWARATDVPGYHVPEPPLDWSKFELYEQPQSDTLKVSVPVLFWRYMDSADPAVAGMDQFDKFSLDAVAPSAEKSLLKVEEWKLATVDSAGQDSVLTPALFGIDRGASLRNQMAALTKETMKLPEFPSTYRYDDQLREFYLNIGVKTGGLKGKPTFAGRYYTGRPIDHRDLVNEEAQKISRSGVDIVTFFQGKARYDQVPNYLLTPNQGKLDALAAFSYAAEVIGQPPHTPVYFAIDTDVSNASAVSVADIIRYFSDVNDGYREYQTSRRIFSVSGITSKPLQGAVYTHNGSSWTVIYGDITSGRGTVECWRSVGAAEPLESGTLTKESGTGDSSLTFDDVRKGNPIPYYIGVYSCWNVMDALYSQGLASYFWQAWPFTWGERAAVNPYPNLKIWPHANIWQILLANTFSRGYWALGENKRIIEAAGGVNVGFVVATDGKDCICIKDHTSSSATKPVTGASAGNYWVYSPTTGQGRAWADATAYKAPSVVVGTDGSDYLCLGEHTSSDGTKPITGTYWMNYWVSSGTVGRGQAWAGATAYKSFKGPVDLNVAWGDTGGWKIR